MSRELYSLGNAATRMRQNAMVLFRAAERLGVEPAMTIDGVPHYDKEDLDRLNHAILTKAATLAPRPARAGDT